MSKQGLPTHLLSQERGTQVGFKKPKNTPTPPKQQQNPQQNSFGDQECFYKTLEGRQSPHI